MRLTVDIVGWINLGLFSLAAVVAVLQWRRHRSRAALWAVLTFGSLAVVADVGPLLPDEPDTFAEHAAHRLLIAVLVLFPYLLYRFTTAFQRPTRRLEQRLGVMTVLVMAWTFVLPAFPAEDEAWPGWFVAYVAGFLVHWTILSVIVGYRLWRAGRDQPSIPRKRMRLLAASAVAITAALLLAGTGSDRDSAVALASGLLASVSAIGFVAGLAPPAWLRLLWRRPEQEQIQAAIAGLMTAGTEEAVLRDVLPASARLVGARAVAVVADDGRVLGSHGATDQMLAAANAGSGDEEIIRLPVPLGSFLVWTSAYSPFFGSDELAALRTLGALTSVALDRARLFAQEREARVALERADEVKTSFISLAAHELRTPVTVIYGVAETIRARSAQLAPERIAQLQETLTEQTRRLASLVEQLLDLSRLDADAIALNPERVSVRKHVEEIVSAAAGEHADAVKVEVPPELETVVDPDAFDRILSNLVVNAVRYGAPPVRVSAEQRDRHFRLTVEDRGPGVPPEFVPQLFERFARGGSASAGGSGLGLAIARSYARALHGDLVYEPAKPRGSRFQLVLPTNG